MKSPVCYVRTGLFLNKKEKGYGERRQKASKQRTAGSVDLWCRTKESTVFAWRQRDDCVEGTREVLDVCETTLVGNLSYGEVFVLEKFAGVVDTHLDDGLFGWDAIDGFI